MKRIKNTTVFAVLSLSFAGYAGQAWGEVEIPVSGTRPFPTYVYSDQEDHYRFKEFKYSQSLCLALGENVSLSNGNFRLGDHPTDYLGVEVRSWEGKAWDLGIGMLLGNGMLAPVISCRIKVGGETRHLIELGDRVKDPAVERWHWAPFTIRMEEKERDGKVCRYPVVALLVAEEEFFETEQWNRVTRFRYCGVLWRPSEQMPNPDRWLDHCVSGSPLIPIDTVYSLEDRAQDQTRMKKLLEKMTMTLSRSQTQNSRSTPFLQRDLETYCR